MAALAALTTLYSCYYAVRYTRPSCTLKLSPLMLGGLFWDSIILPWAWLVYANFSIM